MTNKEITAKIGKVLEVVLEHNNFEMREDLKASEIDGWDSLTHMMIITAIEDDFNVKFKLREISRLENLGDLISLVVGKLNKDS